MSPFVMQILAKFVVGLVPLALTLLGAALLMEGVLNLGGGEKDIFLAIPLLLWSLTFLVAYLVTARGQSVRSLRPLGKSALIATGLLAVAWVLLFGAILLQTR
jgi:hypothetical protein